MVKSKASPNDSTNGINDDNNSNNNNNSNDYAPVIPGWEAADPEDEWIGPKGVSKHLNKGVQTMKWVIRESKKNYDKTGNLEALQITLHVNIALQEMIDRIKGLYGKSYGDNFDLTE